MVVEEPEESADSQSSTAAASEPDAAGPVEPAAVLPPSASASLRVKRVRQIVAAAVATSVVLGFGIYAATKAAVGPSGPVETVEAFFDAVVDKDVETALSLVGRIGLGVPYGEQAAFLHPDAIADGWGLLEAEEAPQLRGGDTYVDVVLGDGEDTAEGRMEVSDFGGEWRMVDPFVSVEIAATPFTYIQVNDRIVVTEELYAHDLSGLFVNQYKLFPGLTDFFKDMPGVDAEPEAQELLFPLDDNHDSEHVAPPELDFPDSLQQAAQAAVEELVDECAEFATPSPPYCPFGVDSYFPDHDEDHYFSELREVEWTVEEHPTVSLNDPGVEERELGLGFTIEDPGLIRLSAVTDSDSDRNVELVAACEVVDDPLRAALTPEGELDVYQLRAGSGVLALPMEVGNTCELEDVG